VLTRVFVAFGVVVAACSLVMVGSSPPSGAIVQPPCCIDSFNGSAFHGVAPVRILDSRTGTGGWNARLQAGQPQLLSIAGVGTIPTTAHAVALNVTVTGSSAGSFLTVYPEGIAQPNTSDINFGPGETIPNAVTVGLGDNGGIAVANAVGSVDVVIDLVGWYSQVGADGDSFFATVPTRLLDSRTATGGWSGALPAGDAASRPLSVTQGAVASTATNVVLTVTATQGTANSFLTAWPTGGARPTASFVNFARGQTIANTVTVPVGANGTISLFNAAGAVQVVVDVVGYFDPAAGGRLHVLDPRRLFDSRVPVGVPGPWGPAQTQQVPMPPFVIGNAYPTHTAYLMNITATNATSGSFLSTSAYGAPANTSSFLNFGPGQTIAARTTMSLEPSGFAGITNRVGAVDLVGDLSGYYALDFAVLLATPTNSLGNQLNAPTNPSPPTCAQHQPESSAACGAQPMVWAAIDGPQATIGGDPFGPTCTGVWAPGCVRNLSYRTTGYDFAIDVGAADVGKPLTISVYDASTKPRTVGAGATFDCNANAPPFDQAPYSTTPGVFAGGFGPANCQTGDTGTPQNLDLQLFAAHRAAPPSASQPLSDCHLLVKATDPAGFYKNCWASLCTFVPTVEGRYLLRARNSALFGCADRGNGTNAFALRVDGGSRSTISPLRDASTLMATASSSNQMYLAEVTTLYRGSNLDIDIFGLGGAGPDPTDIQILGPAAGAPSTVPVSGSVVPATGVATTCTYNAVVSPTQGPATPDTAPVCHVVAGTGSGPGPYRNGWLRVRIHLAPEYECDTAIVPDCWWTLRTTNSSTFTALRFTWSVHLSP